MNEEELPKLWELLETKLKYTVEIKISVNTARMMVEREKGGRKMKEEEAKFTPGPWEYIDIIGACFVKAGQREVLSYTHSPDKENRANARLTAAAPDLLEALIEVVRLSDRKCDEWDRAKAAIAKAEGRKP